ncbi:hypothetical protein FG379_003150 [Cryptosporidium bovis]|uniref:uncharacterized protein n=1 Tax=Cryptosporidium bovis TaxID=310047 RepID=UPI00351A823B|nr:hypothetical protein FG379_003150 [Cryptosporidium bovis]
MYKGHGNKVPESYFSSSFDEELITQSQALSESTASDIGWSVQDPCMKSEEIAWDDSIKNNGLVLNEFGSFIGNLGDEPICNSKESKTRCLNNSIFNDNPIAVIPCGLLYPIVFIGNIPPNVSFEYLKSVILSSLDARNEDDGHTLLALNYQPSYKEWRTAYATFKTWSCAQKVIQNLHLRRHFKNVPFHRLVACISPTPPPSVLSSSFESAYDPQEAEQIITEFQEINRRMIMYQPTDTEIWLPSFNRIEKNNSFFGAWDCFRRDQKMYQLPARWMQYYRENGVCEYWDSYTGTLQTSLPVNQSKDDRMFLPTTITLLRDGPGGANLFIYGIPNDWTEVTLMQLCQKFGHIVGIRLPTASNNGKLNRCFGFISYDNKPSTWAAIRSIAGIKFFGKPLKIQLKAGEDALLPLTLRPIVEGSSRGGKNNNQDQLESKHKNGYQNMYFGCNIPRNNGSNNHHINSFPNTAQLHCNFMGNPKQSRQRPEANKIRMNPKLESTFLIEKSRFDVLEAPHIPSTSKYEQNSSFSDFFRIQSTPPQFETLENNQLNADYQSFPQKSANLQMLLKNILIYDNSNSRGA